MVLIQPVVDKWPQHCKWSVGMVHDVVLLYSVDGAWWNVMNMLNCPAE